MVVAKTGEIPRVWLYPFVLPHFHLYASISSCLRYNYVCILIFLEINYEFLLFTEVACFHEESSKLLCWCILLVLQEERYFQHFSHHMN